MDAQRGNGKPVGISPAGERSVAMDLDEEVPPGEVLDLAAACVRFVMTKLKIEPDFTSDTLPLVDHYVAEARAAIEQQPETVTLTAHAVGAYLGEVIRRTHNCWWRIDRDDPGAWRLEFRAVYLAFYPVQVAHTALTREDDSETFGGFELPKEDQEGLKQRLAKLPMVREEEYFAPSTRLEILDILVDALLAKRARDPSGARPYGPDDYM